MSTTNINVDQGSSIKSIVKNLELILMPLNALAFVGVILLAISGPLNVIDLEIWGYILIGISAIACFFVSIGFRGVLSRRAQKENNKGLVSLIPRLLGLLLDRLPALLLSAQFFYLAWNVNNAKDWIGKTVNSRPAIYDKIKKFINLGLFIQLIIYFKYYTVSLRSIGGPSFNTGAFAIISLITCSLIVYLNIIMNYFVIDG